MLRGARLVLQPTGIPSKLSKLGGGTMFFYRVVMICLIPCVVYDWLTSFLGAVAIFNISSTSPAYFWGIPLAMSVGAVGMNFVTTEVMAEDGAPDFMKIFWFLCILFDVYTTFLGLIQVKLGGGIFSIKTINPLTAFGRTELPELAAFLIATMVFVVSPMATWWLWKRSKMIVPT